MATRFLEKVHPQQMTADEVREYGNYLAESKWSSYKDARYQQDDRPANFMVGLSENREKKATLAILLENLERLMNSMDESTRAVHIGDFQKYAFPLVRAIFPELIANSLVSIQPMLGPISLIFYLDFLFGTQKGRVTKGTTMFSSTELGPNEPSYTSELIQAENIGTGDTSLTRFVANLSHLPIRPGSLKISTTTSAAVPLVVSDDGAGGLLGSTSAGSINYNTGALDVTFSSAPGSVAIAADYSYDLEGQPDIPEVEMVLTSSPVVATRRKMKAKWSLEAGFDLRSLHGLDIEVEVTSAMGAEIRYEIDRQIITDLRRIVPAVNVADNWSKGFVFGTSTTDVVSFTEHKLSIIDAFTQAANKIFRSTGRAVATWMVMSVDVADFVETLPGWVATPGMPTGLMKGPYRAGTLNGRWEVFKDPFYAANEYLMGYKGTSMLEAGYVYAPYIPLYTTPSIVLDDFIGRKGFATQYGLKVINPRFYTSGKIVA